MDNSSKTYGILDIARHNFKKTADRLGLDDAMVARLGSPKERIEVRLHPKMLDGRIVQAKAFIVRHSASLGPSKGGIRMSPSVTIDDVEGLAMEMTWKTSLIGVPFGGGKSGICYDPTDMSPDEKEIIIRSMTRNFMRHIGPNVYIPAPDMGTNAEDMGHVRDCLAYSTGKAVTDGCYVTGKPVILGGIVGRREATGSGVVFSTVAACEKLGIDIKGAKVSVQGFGNVGSVAAQVISKQYGAKVVAISDVYAGIKNEDGIDVDALIDYVAETGSIKDFPGSTEIGRDAVLTVDCDILIPAATQAQITVANCNKVKAKIIAEGANAPTEPGADDILNQKGVFIIPDILCNAGGVFVSYLEYTQETQREQMTLEQVETRLKRRMETRFEEVYEYAKANQLSMRESAMDIAVNRVVEGTVAMGFLP